MNLSLQLGFAVNKEGKSKTTPRKKQRIGVRPRKAERNRKTTRQSIRFWDEDAAEMASTPSFL